MSDQPTRMTGWQLDQSAPEAYEEYLVPAIFASWTERLLDHARVQQDSQVLDIACGTGIVARRAADRVGPAGSVVGLDLNEGMLAVAEETANREQQDIEWRQGDALDLPFADGGFDIICCQQALQFFDDPVAALEEIRRVLTPGGHAVLSVWRPIAFQPAYSLIADALGRHVGADAETMMRSPFPEWDMEHFASMTDKAGWKGATVTIEIGSMRYPSVYEFVRGEAASSPLANQLASIDTESQTELTGDVRNGLERYTDDQGITTPMESFVLRWET